MGLDFTIRNQSNITFNVDPPGGVAPFQIPAAQTSPAQETVGDYRVDEFNNPGAKQFGVELADTTCSIRHNLGSIQAATVVITLTYALIVSLVLHPNQSVLRPQTDYMDAVTLPDQVEPDYMDAVTLPAQV